MVRTTHPPVTLSGVLRGLFLRDLGRKLVALVLAVGLWFLISRVLRDNIERALPLVVVTNQFDRQFIARQSESIVIEPSEDLMVLEPKPNTAPNVDVLFSGPTTLLEAEGVLRPSARFAIPSDFCAGDAPRDFELDPQAILINGLKPKPGIVVRIKNAPKITLARRATARIRIDYHNFPVTGDPRAGWVLEDRASQILPEARDVTLRGPTAEVRAVEADPGKLKFEPLRIKDLEGSFPLSVGLDKGEHPLLELEPTRIRVEVRLREMKEDRTLTNVRVVPLYLEELLKESPKLKDIPAAQSPIVPAVNDDRWRVNVTLSAPRTFWITTPDPEVLRDRIFLFVDLKSMIGTRLLAKSLPVQFAGLRGAQNEPWPEEVQFRELKPDQIKVELNIGQ
ncbi:MAG: hypothetical protein U1E76_12410 [Planctomycetota bacterium]